MYPVGVDWDISQIFENLGFAIFKGGGHIDSTNQGSPVGGLGKTQYDFVPLHHGLALEKNLQETMGKTIAYC